MKFGEAYELVWNNGDDRDGAFLTNCPKEKLLQIMDEIQKVEDYCTDDFYEKLESEGYWVESLEILEVDF